MFTNELWNKPAGATGIYPYQIANSLRLNGTSQALERSFSSTPSNADAKALSFWIKRSGASGTNSAFGSTTNTKLCSSSTGSGAVADMLEINTNNPTGYSDQFHYYLASGGANFLKAKWRDPSAWIHIVWIYNSDESTTTDRIKVYINGESNTINDSNYWDNDGNNGYPSSGADTSFGLNGNEMHIGRYVYDDAGWWGGQMADFIMIDGTASISDFGETHNGVWRPKDPSGLTFGTNGFWLKFTNASNPGEDFSGNDNDFTNIGSIATHDQMLDSPTFNSSSNGGNFPTYNPLLKAPTGLALAEGNLKATLTSDDNGIMTNWQVPVTGKWYWEVDVDDIATDHGVYIGVMPANTDLTINQEQNDLGLVYYNLNGNSILKGTRSSYGATWAEGDIISIAVDRTADTLQFYKNGAGQGTIDISSLDEEFFCYMGYTGGSGPCSTILNFGQDGTFAGNVTAGGNSDGTGYGNFKYSVPSGFLAICSGNQPVADEVDPAQTDDNYPQKTFTALAYSGNNGGSFTTGFQPDLVWVKRRDGGQSNGLWDSTRGTTKILISNETDAEATSSGLTAFGSTGYTMGTYYNQSGNTYASWSWRANGGTTSTNTQGDINSTVQVDPSGCFSIVKYTGGLSSSGVETVGHGLSTAPSLFITKSLEKTGNWWVFSDGQTNWNYGMNLNSTGASTDKSGNGSMSAPTSTVFSTNYTDGLNENGNDLIAYVFANCEGYIKSGSYVGNGDGSDGTFVYTGFKPAWIMVKKLTSNNWRVQDNARDPYNPAYHMLLPNSSNAEDAYTDGTDYNDFLSNGFKLARGGDAVNWNASGATYIYLAMAHNPFKYATAR